jgi:hypothetical protein
LLNKNGSVIECIFNVGESFYTACEHRKQCRREWRRSETSTNKTYPNTGERQEAEVDMVGIAGTFVYTIGLNFYKALVYL